MNDKITALESEQKLLRVAMENNAARIAELRQAELAERKRKKLLRFMGTQALTLRHITLRPNVWGERGLHGAVRYAVTVELDPKGVLCEIRAEEIPAVISFLQSLQEIAEDAQ